MKTVTLTRDMRPWRDGDDIHVPDDVAGTLIAAGEARDARPFPPGSEVKEPERRRYLTKGKRHA